MCELSEHFSFLLQLIDVFVHLLELRLPLRAALHQLIELDLSLSLLRNEVSTLSLLCWSARLTFGLPVFFTDLVERYILLQAMAAMSS